MYNKTTLDWLSETKDEVVELCLLRWIEIVVTIVFLVGMSGGRRRWQNIIHALGFVHGLVCLGAPSFYVNAHFTGTPDAAHLVLMQMLGFLILCWALSYWLLAKSTDSTTETSFLFSHTVVSCCIFLATAYSLMHPSKKAGFKVDEGMKVSMFYGDLLIVVGNLYFYLSAKDWGGYGEVKNHANFHLRLEFLCLLCMGLMMYALPQWMVRLMTEVDKLDSMHTFFARVIGSVLIGMSLMSGRAANFLRDEHKDGVVLSHLLFYVMLVITSWYTSVQMWSELSWKQAGLTALHHAVLVFNAIGALNMDPMVFNKVVMPRIKAIPRDVKSCFTWRY